jgi:hypothetical protein
MATRRQVDDYREAVNDLSTLAIGDLNEAIGFVSEESPVNQRNSLIRLLPQVVTPYVTAASDLAATWYEDLRANAVGGPFYATSNAAVSASQINALVRFGVKPLFGQSGSTVLSLMGGGVQKLVAGAGRSTIDTNIARDRVKVGYARIPQAGCCAFCGLMASRGAVYGSAETAGASKKFHNFCRCVVIPVFAGAENPAYTETRSKFLDLYRQTDGLVENKNGEKVTNLKATLASWRKEHGSK